MKVNMDVLRKNLTIDANQLGESLQNFISEPETSFDKTEVIEAFNTLAQEINILNSIYDDKDKSFNELPETINVYPLPNED